MKKLIIRMFILIIFISIFICKNVYADTPTLQQIADVFNNCSTIKEGKEIEKTWSATATENKLTIASSEEVGQKSIEYVLNGNILSARISTLKEIAIFDILVDSIGTLHGYSDGDMFETLTSEEIKNYTLSEEGLEIKQDTSGESIIQIDISKKIPLIDNSSIYITVSDLEYNKEGISGDEVVEKTKGNIWFNKSKNNKETIVLVAEKDKLTENAYKSILSIIEVMFDSSKAADYFKSNYTGISVGNKEFTGFKIELNPTNAGHLIPYSDYKFVRITIDKNEASKVFANSTGTIETVNTENKVANLSVMPKTGEQQNSILDILYIIIAVAIIGILILIVTRKKA